MRIWISIAAVMAFCLIAPLRAHAETYLDVPYASLPGVDEARELQEQEQRHTERHHQRVSQYHWPTAQRTPAPPLCAAVETRTTHTPPPASPGTRLQRPSNGRSEPSLEAGRQRSHKHTPRGLSRRQLRERRK